MGHASDKLNQGDTEMTDIISKGGIRVSVMQGLVCSVIHIQSSTKRRIADINTSDILSANNLAQNICYSGKSTVSCDTNVPISEWSAEAGFLHGADLMLPASVLFSKLLRPNEQIKCINSLRFNGIMKTHLKMTVSLNPFTKNNKNKKPLIEAEFITDKNKKIYLRAYSNNQKINLRMNKNPFADNMICACEDHRSYDAKSGFFKFKILNIGVNKNCVEPELLRGIILSTYMDIINKCSEYLREKKAFKDKGLCLVAGYENLALPDFDSLFSGEGAIKIKVLNDETKKSKSGFNIIPFLIQFCSKNAPVREGKYYVAAANSTKSSENYCARG